MTEVNEIIMGAKRAILFLLFKPGSPSVVQWAADAQAENPELFVRGAATDETADTAFKNEIRLIHHGADVADGEVVEAGNVKNPFGYWEKELLKATPNAHAIIHDKIVVVDPFSDDCVVVTGSHNLGYKASYCNDENLLIVRGNKALAAAYTAHVLDVYDHFRWRYFLGKKGDKAWNGLEKDDGWQDKYYKPGSPSTLDAKFWFG
jgi:phosphatidylserine/phosphatidylglycerophosphate/cardiolipin synthase-like enzyme